MQTNNPQRPFGARMSSPKWLLWCLLWCGVLYLCHMGCDLTPPLDNGELIVVGPSEDPRETTASQEPNQSDETESSKAPPEPDASPEPLAPEPSPEVPDEPHNLPDQPALPEPSSPDEPTPEPRPEPRPEPQPEPTSPLTLVVLSDLNGSYGSTSYGSLVHSAVAAITQRIKPDLVLATGDLVAGQKKGLDYIAMWKGFHAAVTTPLQQAGIPFAPTPGNHDASGYSAYQQERQEYVRQWSQHRPALRYVDDASYPLRYAFVKGGILFVSLDATTVGPLSSSQRQWLDQLLAMHSQYKVKVVFGHIPTVPIAIGRESEVLGDAKLEDIFVKHGVTAYLSGHHHAYFPGKRKGVRMVSMPCAGSGPRPLVGTSTTAPKGIVVMKISAAGITAIEGYKGSQLSQLIPRSQLPKVLNANTSKALHRDDVAP